MAPEEAVYLCGWSHSADGFELWVKSRPHVRARGRSYAETKELFLEEIIRNGGAHHAVLEFVPPLPQTDFDQRYSQPEIVGICGDDRFETDEPKPTSFETPDARHERECWYDSYFEAPLCRVCRTPGGPRNERPLNLTYVNRRYDGGFVCFAGATLRVFSEDFLMMLSGAERRHLKFQRVQHENNSKKQFFELLGPSGPPRVAIAGIQFSGWRCDSCGTRTFGRFSEESAMIEFVARADLPQPLPEVFTIGSTHDLQLCVTANRWSRMVGRRGTKGIVSSPLGVVSNADLLRSPELQPRRV